jgi:hypothetical protein
LHEVGKTNIVVVNRPLAPGFAGINPAKGGAHGWIEEPATFTHLAHWIICCNPSFLNNSARPVD